MCWCSAFSFPVTLLLNSVAHSCRGVCLLPCSHLNLANIYPHGMPLPSTFILLIERGSMSRGSHLFGQSTLINAWRQTILQPYSIFKNCCPWNSCLIWGWVGILLMIVVPHWVAVASFTSEALYFQNCCCWWWLRVYEARLVRTSTVLPTVHVSEIPWESTLQSCLHSPFGERILIRLPRWIKWSCISTNVCMGCLMLPEIYSIDC